MTQATFSETHQVLKTRNAEERSGMVLSKEVAEMVADFFFSAMNYDEVRRQSFPIERLDGRFTNKFLTVVVTRMCNGRYELVDYVL